MSERFNVLSVRTVRARLLPLRLVVVPVSCRFLKSSFSPRSSPPLFGNSLISFCSITFNKKLIRRWDSERELSLRRHRARTTKYNRLEHKFRHRSTRLCVGTHVFTKFSEITQYNGHYVVQGHSRSPILVPIESSYTTSYYWLIVTYLLFCTVSKLWSNFRWREGIASL